MIAWSTGVAVGGLGAAGVLGWLLDLRVLVQFRSDWVAMQFNAALCFLAAGAGLVLTAERRPRLGAALGAGVTMVGLLTILQYVTGLDFGIDQLFCSHQIVVHTSHPGRMAFNSAMCFAIAGAAIVIMALDYRVSWHEFLVAMLGASAAAIALTTIMGYWSRIEIVMGWWQWTLMALQTALGFLALGAALICLACRRYSLKHGVSPSWAPLPVIIMLLVASLIFGTALIGEESERKSVGAKTVATTVKELISTEVESRVRVLERMARRWASGVRQPQVWEADAQAHYEHLPGLLTIEWVHPSRRERWVAPHSSVGSSEMGSMSAEPGGLAFFDSAQSTGVAQLSGTLSPGNGLHTFSVCVPIRGTEEFLGFIFGTFSSRDSLSGILQSFGFPGYRLRVLEGTEPIYERTLAAGMSSPSTPWVVEAVDPQVLGWRVHVAPEEGAWGQHGSLMLAAVTILGYLFTLIFALNLGRKAHLRSMAAEREVKARRLVEEELRRARDNADVSNQAKSDFLANMSHEIRTPMTAILGYADMMLDGEQLEPSVREQMIVIRENGKHLLSLLNDLLDLSKLEAGKMLMESIPCRPAEIITAVVSLLANRALEKGVELATEQASPVPEVVLSDPTRLRQILLNLIGNAVKFTDKGSIRIITSLLEPPGHQDQFLIFEVIDSGIGLSAEEKGRLFQKFVQADSSSQRKYGGTGLGLAISKRIAQLLGGDIVLQSFPGEGSSFIAAVTVKVPPGTRVLDSTEAVKSEASNADVGSKRLPRLEGRVLIADDVLVNRRIVSALLEKRGVKVETAINGTEAVEKAWIAFTTGVPFDVILMDMQMPEMDGYDATRELRARHYKGAVIALTASAMTKEREKCLEHGCDDFLSKPIDRERLFAVVSRYLREGDSKVLTPESSIAATP